MRAAVLAGVDTAFHVTEVDLAPPRAGEMLVKIAATGLCRSDLNAITGKRTLVPFPAVLGHEASGVVAQCAPGVRRLREGDAVLLSIVPSCGTCPPCLRARPNHCTAAAAAMAAGTLMDGTRRLSSGGRAISHFLTVSSFAQYAVVPESGAVRLPDAMPLVQAALLSCAVLTGFGAVHNTARVTAGSRVVVYGCGGVGLNIIQGARLAGAARIIAVDVSASKLELAARLGATDVIDASDADAGDADAGDASGSDPAAAVHDLVGGADYAFEALGDERTVQRAWASLDAGGQLVLVGLLPTGARLALDADRFVAEQSIKGCYFGSADLSWDVGILAGHYLRGDLLLDELISRRISLDHLNDAFGDLRAGRGARSVVVFDE